MLGENIRALRRAKGMSQEELAARLHVVRQTISKWEKGLSVPDADLLQRLADVFETDVAALLGAPQQQETQDAAALLSQQLANINAQLAEKNRRSRRIWRTVAGVLIGLAVLYLLLIVFSLTAYRTLSFEDTVDSYYSAPASVGE
ncbi:MAG: helix-turn-helix domain-containing protein [Eubacteriales bacterium]|nr:helix-turn-helix domain-containing protein [Eubacteriales bacterium]